MNCSPHHYVLEEPNGPEVHGQCKHCGHTRTWSAWPEGLDGWTDFTVHNANATKRSAQARAKQRERAWRASAAARQKAVGG